MLATSIVAISIALWHYSDASGFLLVQTAYIQWVPVLLTHNWNNLFLCFTLHYSTCFETQDSGFFLTQCCYGFSHSGAYSRRWIIILPCTCNVSLFDFSTIMEHTSSYFNGHVAEVYPEAMRENEIETVTGYFMPTLDIEQMYSFQNSFKKLKKLS